jgi:hypothetical protein
LPTNKTGKAKFPIDNDPAIKDFSLWLRRNKKRYTPDGMYLFLLPATIADLRAIS